MTDENRSGHDSTGAKSSREAKKVEEKPSPKNSSIDSEEGTLSSGSADDLDFSQDGEIENRAKVAAPHVAGDYDPRPHEDGARRTIAYLLISLLRLVVSAMFILVSCGSIAVAEIKEFAVVLGPVVTLVSAATGFYYGTKSSVQSVS